MSDDRWVVLGLAHPRAAWFGELARWSTGAAIPVDFVKCVSPDEVRARLRGGRSLSALLVGGDVVGLDRDLVDSVRLAGGAVIVTAPVADRDWAELGVSAVLPAGFDRADLLSTLAEHATPIERVAPLPSAQLNEPEGSWRGRLIAVTGPGGSGASVTAMAVAQAFADEPSNSGMVLLADLALDAEQGMLHDAREMVPGVQELCEAHRGGRLAIDEVRDLTFDATNRGYHLLLGLRRHRDWTAIRPRAFSTALDGTLRSYRLVVADVDADVEGEDSTGSIDVEDRNTMARVAIARAELVVAVGNPTTKGLHALARVIRNLLASGLDADRILPVCTRSPRSPRRRAEASHALARLLDTSTDDNPVGNPVFLAERADVETAIRDGLRLPTQLCRPLHAEMARRLQRPQSAAPDPAPALADVGVPVAPGSLGAWTEQSP